MDSLFVKMGVVSVGVACDGSRNIKRNILTIGNVKLNTFFDMYFGM